MARSGTSFQKGKSGNPGGRRALPADAKEAFAAACPAAVAALVALLDSKSEPIRMRAAEIIVNRHLGPPAAPVAAPTAEDPRRRLVVVDGNVGVDVDE